MFKVLKNVKCDEAGDDKGGTGGNEPTLESLQAQLAEVVGTNTTLKADNERLSAKVSEANKHTRNAEEKARLEAEDKAKNDGDHKQLYESAIAANQALQVDLDNLKSTSSTEKRDNAAMDIATVLADGENAQLLKPFIAQRLKHTDEGLKVTDANGNLTVSTLDDLATEFKNNARYSALLKGNQSNGGGANGGKLGGGAANVMTRGDFETLNPIAAAKFMSEGGSVTD